MKIRIPLSVALLVLLASVSLAIQRDHLTEQEVDLVKEAQALDKRVEVFIKATDRRLIVLNGTQAANAKLLKKDAELWGDLPAGSHAELIGDIARILDEAITNIDDVSSRDERNPLIAKALRRLGQATTNIMTQVAPLKEKASGDAEVASFELLEENAEQILEAAKKLPPEPEKKGKTKN
jgi:hypothetical protein